MGHRWRFYAILRVDPNTREIKRWPLPRENDGANLNTAAFDGRGRIWFTGQSGIFGRLDPKTGEMKVWDAPRGTGPYGITATPDGQIWYVSLAGSYLGRPNLDSGEVIVIDPPRKASGTRRVWSDSSGRLWVSEWNAGTLSAYDPQENTWRTWALPGQSARAYAVYVDDENKVWVSDFSANAILRFDPKTEKFASFPSTRDSANVRQMAGRHDEVWGGRIRHRQVGRHSSRQAAISGRPSEPLRTANPAFRCLAEVKESIVLRLKHGPELR